MSIKYTTAGLGRVFILRLENDDRIPDVIEKFAQEQQIHSALVHLLGGADGTSKIVVGPLDGAQPKPQPVVTSLPGVSETIGLGTIFLDEKSTPKLHLHASFGRGDKSLTGCTREGVFIWHIGEVIILELLNSTAGRKIDPATGFELLEV